MKVRTIDTYSGRVTVLPPPLWPQSRSWSRPNLLRRMLLVLLLGANRRSHPVYKLSVAKAEFLAPLRNTLPIYDKVQRARSLRELWHLRTDVYNLICMSRTQLEAEKWCTAVSRYFPTECKRSRA